MSLRCLLGIHFLSRYSTRYTKVVERPGFFGSSMAQAKFAARKCSHCGYIREIRQTPFHQVNYVFDASMIFSGLSQVVWMEDEVRITEETITDFEDLVLDYLWWNKRDKYEAALNFYCAALDRRRPPDKKLYVPKPALP